jgi:hypothetical protein
LYIISRRSIGELYWFPGRGIHKCVKLCVNKKILVLSACEWEYKKVQKKEKGGWSINSLEDGRYM